MAASKEKPTYLCIFQLHSGEICIGRSKRPVDSIANFNRGAHPMAKGSLTVNNVRYIRECNDDSQDNAVKHYLDRGHTIYLLNENETIKPNKKRRTTKRMSKSKQPSK